MDSLNGVWTSGSVRRVTPADDAPSPAAVADAAGEKSTTSTPLPDSSWKPTMRRPSGGAMDVGH